VTTQDSRLTSPAYRQLRQWVLARDRHQCQIRGPNCTHVATQVDHIVARADGGPVFDLANLRAACRTCNMQLAAHRTNHIRYRTSIADMDTRL
jgi:5-methylcytosine-specific restriction protein A